MSLSEEDRVVLWDEIEELQSKMQTAIDQEHYEEAAKLRDSIKSLKMQDPYTKAENELEEAVKCEKYEDASRLRSIMKEVGKPPLRRKRDDGMSALEGMLAGVGATLGELQGIKSYSETVTKGTRVHVKSFYVPEPSAPAGNRAKTCKRTNYTRARFSCPLLFSLRLFFFFASLDYFIRPGATCAFIYVDKAF